MIKKILVVDSSQTIRELFRIKFSYLFKAEIIGAANGHQGLAELKLNPDIDLILLDTEMEDMSSLDFLKQVKGFEAFSTTPVVILAMVGEEDNILRLMSHGASGVFFKNNVRDMDFLQHVLKAMSMKKERITHASASSYPCHLAGDVIRL